MKKRFWIMALLLIAALLLGGCKSDRDPAGTDGVPAGTEGSTNGAVESIGQDWTWRLFYMNKGALTETGYYYHDNCFLCYADLESGKSVTLCNKPGCLHQDLQCDAHLGSPLLAAGDGLFYQDGKLYHAEQDRYGTHLFSRNADGTGREELGILGKQFIDAQKDVETVTCGIAGDWLYYTGNVKGTEMRDGVLWGVTERSYLSRVSLETGKEEILFEIEWEEGKVGSLMLYAVQEDEILFGIEWPYEDGARKVDVRHWKAGKELRIPVDKPAGVCNGILAVTGKTLYYAGTEGMWAYDLQSGQEERVADKGLTYLGNGYAMGWSGEGNAASDYLIYELETGKTLPIDMQGDLPKIVCAGKDGIVIWTMDGGVETPGGIQYEDPSFWYVPYTALADGIQREEARFLFQQTTDES